MILASEARLLSNNDVCFNEWVKVTEHKIKEAAKKDVLNVFLMEVFILKILVMSILNNVVKNI